MDDIVASTVRDLYATIRCEKSLDSLQHLKRYADTGHKIAMSYYCNVPTEEGGPCIEEITDILEELLPWLQAESEHGNPDAQYNLGRLSDVIFSDSAAAMRYCLLAAYQGHAIALYSVGFYYHRGKGVDRNFTEALRYYRESAASNYAVALFQLGKCFQEGEGVCKDYDEAYRHFRAAAALRSSSALVCLGHFHDQGFGVPVDHTEAFKYYIEAANRGAREAMHNVGVSYAKGEGCEQNISDAIRYYRLAADRGDDNAMFALGIRYLLGNGVQRSGLMGVRYISASSGKGKMAAQEWLEEEGQEIIQSVLKLSAKEKKIELDELTNLGENEAWLMLGELLEGSELGYLDEFGALCCYREAIRRGHVGARRSEYLLLRSLWRRRRGLAALHKHFESQQGTILGPSMRIALGTRDVIRMVGSYL